MGFTAHKSFKLAKGLYLEERKGAAFYKARASVKGRTAFFNTETTDYARAERSARSWFRRLQFDGSPPLSGLRTMQEAAKSFLADIRKPVTREYHEKVWNAISDFFKAMDVDAVTTPVLKNFARWRRQRASKRGTTHGANTLHKDFVTVRRILHHAVEEGWLSALPVFPKGERIAPNPRPWLEPHEWETLQRVAQERIEEAENPRTKRQREDLLAFCMLMVLCYPRVGELRNLRVRDVGIETKQKDKQKYVYMSLRLTGKRGTRQSVAQESAIPIFESVVERNNLKADDLLFAHGQRDGFRELLLDERARLRTDGEGNVRNLKALRSTGLMLKILENPRVNLKLLADNAGTSVAMLEQFYLKRLSVDLKVEELV